MSSPSLNNWLETLRILIPIEGVILVGTGVGTGSLVQWLQQSPPARACLIEGDPSIYQHLERNLPTIPGWTLRCSTVIPNAEPASIHRFSVQTENSLLSVDELRTLWPNLQAVDANDTGDISNGTTLAELLAHATSSANWLILDCLPAAPLLQGAGTAISGLDIILARVVIDETLGVSSAHHGTLNTFLQTAGFRCIHLQPERHPAIAIALYVRDIRSSQAEKQQRIQQLETQVEELKLRNNIQATELDGVETQISLIRDLLQERSS